MAKTSESQRKAVALIIISILGYFYVETILAPQMKKPAPTEAASGSVVSSETSKKEKEKEPSSEQANLASEKVDISSAQSFIVETGVTQLTISELGAVVSSLTLNEHKVSEGAQEPYQMVTHAPGASYPGTLRIGSRSDAQLKYERIDPASDLRLTEQKPTLKISFAARAEDGAVFTKDYTFYHNQYHFDVEAKVSQGEGPLFYEWSEYRPELTGDGGLLDAYDVKGFVWFEGESSERISYTGMEEPHQSLSAIRWVGMGDRYFATAMLDPEQITPAEDSENPLQELGTHASIHFENKRSVARFASDNGTSLKIRVYSGPKSYSGLEEEGFELKRLVDLGKTGFISGPLLSLLKAFYKIVGNWGLAIVLLTIVVKLCLYPLNGAQFKQMKAMQDLKPELDRIKENITDPKQQQLAQMELFKKKGVNPLGGCLPVAVQMPVFIGLYSALMLAVELRHAPFGLWVHDLSAPDSLEIMGIGIPVLVVLFTVSILVQQWTTPTAMDPAQKKAMMIVPIIMFFMFMGFPAGLALYWLTNNLISIGQQQALHYNDRSGKSGFWITLAVAVSVYVIAFVCSKL